MSEEKKVVPTIRIGISSIVTVQSNFITNPETGENTETEQIATICQAVVSETNSKLIEMVKVVCALKDIAFEEIPEEEVLELYKASIDLPIDERGRSPIGVMDDKGNYTFDSDYVKATLTRKSTNN